MPEDWNNRHWLESERSRLVAMSAWTIGRPIQTRWWKQRLAQIEQRLDELDEEQR